MADRLILSSPTGGLRRLGVHGQPVVDSYLQLSAIVRGRLTPAHAALLAKPRVDPQGGRVDWTTELDGAIQRADALPAERRAALLVRAEALRSDILCLADAMAKTGGGELVARLLTLAMTTPGPESLYAVGDQPALILWGHEHETMAVAADAAPTPAPADPPPGAAPGAAPVDPQSAAASGPTGPSAASAAAPHAAETIVVATEKRTAWGWILWALPLLLLGLLLALGLKACEPLPPVVVDKPDPNPPPPVADPTPDLAARVQSLKEQLTKQEQERKALLDRCVVEPKPEPPKPLPPPTPEKEPEKPLPLPAPPPEPEQPRLDLVPLDPTPEKPLPVRPVPIKPEPVKPEPVKPPPVKPEPVKPDPIKPEPVKPAPAPAPAPRAEGPKPQICNKTYPPGDEPEMMVVVDGSGSMNESFGGGGSRIDQARRALAQVVTGLHPSVMIGLIDFQGCGGVRADKLYSHPERPELLGKVNQLRPSGGTPLAEAIRRAGARISSSVDSVIVVVSDGDDTCHGDPCAAARALKANRPRAVINVIDISGDAKGRSVIECVASVTGGQVLKPNSPSELRGKLQQATRQPDMSACRK